jgi:hypothetical protein
VARDGPSLALGESLTASATGAYQRLVAVLENAADLRAAQQVYEQAYDLCVANEASEAAQVCLVCLAYILWETGRWDEAEKLERKIITSPERPPGIVAAAKAATGIFFATRAKQGNTPPLVQGLAYARRHHRLRFELNSLVGLTWREALEGSDAAAAERYREIVRRCRKTRDLHYAPMALRSAVTFFAGGEGTQARACAALLADMASATTNRETLAALAHALGEIAMLEREPDDAVVEFARALDLLRELELPYQRALTQGEPRRPRSRGAEPNCDRPPDGRLPHRTEARSAAARGYGSATPGGTRRTRRAATGAPRDHRSGAWRPHAS